MKGMIYMSKALELRQKRAELWEKAKLFLDNAKRDTFETNIQ